MATEIERKFVVTGDGWRTAAADAQPMRQGYFATTDATTVRVRSAGEQAWLTVKGPTVGISRLEFEYPVPVSDADAMLDSFCQDRQVSKVRHTVEHGGHTWVVDVFDGDNAGLVLAEVELDSPDEPVELPGWLGREVSHDRRYRNGSLARHPFSQWQDQDTAGGRPR